MHRYFIALLAATLISLFGLYFQPSFAETLEEFRVPRSSKELLQRCKSIDPNKREYCQGYIDGTSHSWRITTACQSTNDSDQSFCAGSIAAREKFQNLSQTCKDCDFERYKQLYREGSRLIGKCSPNDLVNSSYCEGFNLQVTMETIAPGLIYEPEAMDNARVRGLGQGIGDFVLHLWGFEVMHYLSPCIERRAESESMILAINAFADNYPELLQLDSPTIFLTKALFYGLCPRPMEHLLPHMEHCTDWNYNSGDLGVDNSCEEIVSIQFQADIGPIIEGQLRPKERFRTGLSSRNYMTAACQQGYVSSVLFLKENWGAIARSQYHCVRE